jgi:hypothetical protein
MKRRRKVIKNRSKKTLKRFFHTWVANRRGVFVTAVLVAAGIAGFELYGFHAGNSAPSTPGWFIDGNQLQSLIGYSSSSLPARYFNTPNTVVMNDANNTGTYIPSGWNSQAGNHYTSYGTNGCSENKGCYSLMGDLQAHNGSVSNQAPVALYDNENWAYTPNTEQVSPCNYMSQFVSSAHLHGLTTVVAPDQDLAEPGNITSYQGGESENWQTYLRLGLANCAAKTGSEWYHIMSQPFESEWCSNPFEECQSSESDYDNFVTQAALQAKAVNPSIKLVDGLSTNPDYFGFFRGTQTFAKTIYQDYMDTKHIVNAVWMNIIGNQGNLTTVYFLGLVSRGAKVVPQSSVWFLEPNNVLRNEQAGNTQTTNFPLAKAGSTMLFTSSQTIHSKAEIPAGTGDFQFWTDGTSKQSAQLNVTLGYCQGKTCTNQTAITGVSVTVTGSARGFTVPSGAFTTNSDITLPNHGPYHLYVQLNVLQPGSFNLQYGDDTPSNLSTPALLPIK